MIRVLNVIPLVLGGAETTVMNHYRHIDRTKVQFDFWITAHKQQDHYYENEALSLGANIYWFPFRFRRFFSNLRNFSRLMKKNPKIKVIHIHCSEPRTPFRPLLYAILLGIRVRVVHSRNTASPIYISAFKRKLYQAWLFLSATYRLSCSSEAGVALFGKGFGKLRKDTVLPNARLLEPFRYDPMKRKALRQALNLDDKYVMINVGNLRKQKNQFFLLNVFAEAAKVHPDIMLLMVGDGDLRDDLVEHTKNLGVQEKVQFLGQRDDVKDLLQVADVFLFPSFHEGLPGAGIEAQVAGLPCLLSDTISPEVGVTSLVKFLPINKGTAIWVESILSFQGFKRTDTLEKVKQAGYDIHCAAKRLEEFYIREAGPH